MFNIFSRRKQMEDSVQANASALEELQKTVQTNANVFEELQKSIADIKDIVNALAKSRNEEAAPYSQVLDEWLNGKEEQNG